METSKQSTGETLFDLTSYVADTPASLSAPQATVTAQTTLDTFGRGYERPLATFNPDTQYWKMYEATLLSDSTPFSQTLPPSGMTRSGQLFQRPLWVRLIGVIASSFSPTPSGNWPTPTVSDIYSDSLKSSQQSDGSMHSVTLAQAVQMWPTPISDDSKNYMVRRYTNNRDGQLPSALCQNNPELTGGRLNPMWVEWLMGFPSGWTDLKDSETP